MSDKSEFARKAQGLPEEVARRAERQRSAAEEGVPTLVQQFSKVGVLGWLIVAPMLLGLAGGRWLDQHLSSGITFTAASLLLGMALGAWWGWRWMHKP
jgi:ATP synthase protein I